MAEAVVAAPASTMASLKRPLQIEADGPRQPSTPVANRQSSPSSPDSVIDSPLSEMTKPIDTPAASTNPTSTSVSPSKPAATQSGSATKPPPTSTPATAQSSTGPPTKRRKLTPSEKAAKEAEKAQKAAEREAQKAQKEAEQKTKEEEKKRKAEEREAEKKLKVEEKEAKEKQKEEERKAKEEERKKKQLEKDEEKRKKAEERDEKQRLKDLEKEKQEKQERSQMRLSKFFGAPKDSPPAPLSAGKTLRAGASPSKHGLISKDEARRRSMSLEAVPIELASPIKPKTLSNTVAQGKKAVKGFLPFVVGNNVKLAPHNRFLPHEDDLQRVNGQLDAYSDTLPVAEPSLLGSFAAYRTKRGYQPPRVQLLMLKLQGSKQEPIDLTKDRVWGPQDDLKTVPVKYLFYGEDVRPPYKGTWTRPVSPRTARKMALAPLARELPDVNYDYDSEAEWDDADEGEDIELDGEDEEEEEEEEMEGFIDDDNAPQYLARRGLPTIDVEPKCSGLQWEDAKGKLKSADANYADADFSNLAVCFLLDPSPKTIDPFTTAYWDPEPKQAPSTLPVSSLMGPPRLPLSDRTNGQGNIQSTLVDGKVPKAAKLAPRLVPAESMAAFKAAVSGSDMTKIALIEALKKQFPKLKKDEITETLKIIAHRVGSKREEKRWELIADAKV